MHFACSSNGQYSLYGEFLGSGLIISANLELDYYVSEFSDFSTGLRIGYGGALSARSIPIDIFVSYGREHSIRIGGGVTIFTDEVEFAGNNPLGTGFVAARFRFRYQYRPKMNGVLLFIGFDNFFTSDLEAPIWPAIGIGQRF